MGRSWVDSKLFGGLLKPVTGPQALFLMLFAFVTGVVVGRLV